jgi:hypothetical protein
MVLTDESGATTTEYSLIAAGLAFGVIVAASDRFPKYASCAFLLRGPWRGNPLRPTFHTGCLISAHRSYAEAIAIWQCHDGIAVP